METKSLNLTIAIADDHQVFRQGLRNLIESQNIGSVIAEASNGEKCIEIAVDLSPNIILMDIDMPKLDGIEATKVILDKDPNIKIIALSMHNDYEHYQQMVKHGAVGFIQKSNGIDEVISAINAVAQGGSYFSSEILKSIVANMNLDGNVSQAPSNSSVLSSRELEVLELICQGFTNEEIAQKLFISPTTVKGHRSNILSKTETRNTASLIMYAVRNKLIRL